MTTLASRLKLSLVLTLAFYLPAIWMLALSWNPQLAAFGLVKLLGWGLVMSFGAAYAVTLYVSLLKRPADKP